MTATPVPVTQRLQHLDERLSAIGMAAARITLGLMWLANVHWKRPPDFGGKTGTGLARWVNEGISHPVTPPYAWMLREVVRPNLTVFGWITLFAEVLLAVLLVLGLWTRVAALAGAGLSAAIALTILRAPNEWPWAYFLMIGYHLLIAATSTGRHLGIDGWRRSRASDPSSVWTSLGLLGLVSGIAGVVAAAGHSGPKDPQPGSLVGWRVFELKLFWFNMTGALLCVAIGVLCLVAGRLRRSEVALVAAALSWLAALQVLVQWRGTGANERGGVLGGTGGTLCLWLILAIGITVTLRSQPTKRTG